MVICFCISFLWFGLWSLKFVSLHILMAWLTYISIVQTQKWEHSWNKLKNCEGICSYMGLSLSLLQSAWEEIVRNSLFDLPLNISVASKDGALILRASSFKKRDSETATVLSNGTNKTSSSSRLRDHRPQNVVLERNHSFVQDKENMDPDSLATKSEMMFKPVPVLSLPEAVVFSSPRPVSELDAAATKLQKVYKSYRTRRNLADCAVVVEELWSVSIKNQHFLALYLVKLVAKCVTNWGVSNDVGGRHWTLLL